MTVNSTPEITLGPVLFNWKPEVWRDFYFRIADEAPVATVYVGETVCSKRAPLFDDFFDEVVARLKAGGKRVILSGLGEVVQKADRQLVERQCAEPDAIIEANDVSALYALRGNPHHAGPLLNVYNEQSLLLLAERGAKSVCVPAELSAAPIAALCDAGLLLGVAIEVQVFGRVPLALSARCYHARAHRRTKDGCLFVCENDPDGLELTTLDRNPFLVINGIQTMSHSYLNLIGELPELKRIGVSRFRLSPHTCDMVKVAEIFRGALDGEIEGSEAAARLDALKLPAPFSNGFYHGKPGHIWQSAATA
jgi:collagenase-like PrtC family protease